MTKHKETSHKRAKRSAFLPAGDHTAAKEHTAAFQLFFLDSDFCHNYLHTLCTEDLILQCIKR